ncbi:MAG: energy-coupling factor ABC transporter ATP-binding protein, partial [Akkermansia muciniphila]
MSHHLVETIDLCFSYPDSPPALNGVSLRITHGESVAVVGGNGAGKSTLLLHLNGLLTPSSGQVRVGDIPVTPKTVARVRESVGMVFQQAEDQLFMPTVREDVAFGPLNMGLPPEEIRRRVEQALRNVHAEALADKMTHHLSGGEKRAVSIATVLSMSPDILVLDEPSANLDPASRRTLISLLRQFTHTKIIATHDLDMVMDLCTRCIVMKD